MSIASHSARRMLAVLGLLFACGCGGTARAPVTGMVTLDGVPLEKGAIAFEPAAGTASPSAGAEIIQGKYMMAADKGPMPGNFQVKITASKKTGKKIEATSPAPPGTWVEETVEAVPAKYNKDSTLTAKVTAGANTINFELKSE